MGLLQYLFAETTHSVSRAFCQGGAKTMGHNRAIRLPGRLSSIAIAWAHHELATCSYTDTVVL
jgi:hypothetical protein